MKRLNKKTVDAIGRDPVEDIEAAMAELKNDVLKLTIEKVEDKFERRLTEETKKLSDDMHNLARSQMRWFIGIISTIILGFVGVIVTIILN